MFYKQQGFDIIDVMVKRPVESALLTTTTIFNTYIITTRGC